MILLEVAFVALVAWAFWEMGAEAANTKWRERLKSDREGDSHPN